MKNKYSSAFNNEEKNGILFYTAKNIKYIHAFSTRYGGVSEGHLSSLNFAMREGEKPENLRENLRRFSLAVGFSDKSVVNANQVHGTNILIADEEDAGKLYEGYDGFITCSDKVTLAVRIADCAPLLFAGERYVAAIHAGWRGAAADIAGMAARQLISLGENVKNINVAIGPCIHSCCFEVREDFITAVEALRGSEYATRHIKQENGIYHANLPGMNIESLLSAGIPEENISVFPECTCCHFDKFFSHRATGGKRGTMFAAITPVLKE